ncbi:hypothetical protein [Nocardia huaxiensis]|uniref:hypothetical protein n=1 Tax=Nocardia huaxiensis TaxID=2755382 RepID=UPI001E36D884|nr:hypothetical protein [Nocardia huaxiensis]UFS94330.1 hypothetical protein LPY97_26675 [Nocardia huaxiensis]
MSFPPDSTAPDDSGTTPYWATERSGYPGAGPAPDPSPAEPDPNIRIIVEGTVVATGPANDAQAVSLTASTSFAVTAGQTFTVQFPPAPAAS